MPTKTGALVAVIVAASSFFQSTHGQTSADSSAIRQTALDYIEGFYTADADRMERALYSDVAKRIVISSPGQRSIVQEMTAQQLIEATAAGSGTLITDQRRDVLILDVFGNAACVKIVARDWVDYLHIAKMDGNWVIMNVLWEFTPEGKQRWGKGSR